MAHHRVGYLQNIQRNDCLAPPENWPQILPKAHDPEVNKSSDYWTDLRVDHFVVVATSAQLKDQSVSGLPLPLLVTPKSLLGKETFEEHEQRVQARRGAVSPLILLLDKALEGGDKVIAIQDWGRRSLGQALITTTCEDSRNRFRAEPETRGPPWDGLLVDGDMLPGQRGPQVLINDAKVRDWQTT